MVRLILMWFFGCILLLNSANAQAIVDFSPKLQKAYFEIQKLRINTARQLIDGERAVQKNNAFIAYLDNYADLHYLLISEDLASYKKFSEQESARLDLVGQLPDNSPYKRFFQADIRLHWAFAKLKFGNEVSGSWEVIKAYKLLEENRKRFPDFIPTLKSLGLVHVMIGSVPENYSWVARVLGLRGNIKNGISEIRTVVKEEPFFRQEAELIDLLLHAYTLQMSPSQVVRIKKWPREQPDNLLLHFFATTVLMKEGKSEEAANYLAEAPEGPAYIKFPFLHYLRGDVKLQKGDYQSAVNDYQVFLQQYKGFNFLKDGNYKLFMCYWLADRDKEAAAYIKRVGTVGKTILEGDQFAAKFAEEYVAGKIGAQQKILYKARYATDGGFLNEASEFINSTSENAFSSTPEKAEFNYRKARILQKMGNVNAAVPLFGRSIKLDIPGFAALSALQLGYIYSAKNDALTAATYFKQALTYKKHEYKNSVDNKARAALTELGK